MPLVLTDKDVADLLTMEDAIEAVEEAFRQLALGGASIVPRITTPPPESSAQYYLKWLMPGTLHGIGVMGGKFLIASSPGGQPRGRTRFIILLFDSNDGSLLAEMSGSEFTKIRTAAVTAVGTRYLAREESRTLGLIGSSKLAQQQAIAISVVLPIEKIKVYSRTPANREGCAQELRRLLKANVTAVESSDDAVTGSDVIVTCTDSKEPVFRGELLEPGMHVNAIGSSSPDYREVDDQTVLRSKIVAEYLQQTLQEAGDLVIPIKNGVLSPSKVYGEISEIVGGTKPGRVTPEEITLFKTNGIAIEDIACAFKVYKRAREQGRGQEMASI